MVASRFRHLSENSPVAQLIASICLLRTRRCRGTEAFGLEVVSIRGPRFAVPSWNYRSTARMVKKKASGHGLLKTLMNHLDELLPLLARLTEVNGSQTTLAQLAVEDGRSPWHLQRIFGQEVGETPLQYGRRVRLQRAAALLLISDLKVIDIALRSGFDSHEGFTRACKAVFGLPPIEFRSQKRQPFHQLVEGDRKYLATVARVAPCVGLYRTTCRETVSTNERKARMAYKISTKTIEETTFLFRRGQVEPSGLAEAFAGAFVPLFQFVMEQGLPLSGPPTTRYPNFGPGLITYEAGMPIGTTVAELQEMDVSDYEVGTLRSGLAASTIHSGPYDRLVDGHAALQRWITANNEQPGGAPWEVYITDPGEVPDPTEWQTELVHPLLRS